MLNWQNRKNALLNKEDKEKLRKNVAEQLMKVPEGRRIHLPKELVETLLFEKKIEKKTKDIVKFVVWSGPFLRNLI